MEPGQRARDTRRAQVDADTGANISCYWENVKSNQSWRDIWTNRRIVGFSHLPRRNRLITRCTASVYVFVCRFMYAIVRSSISRVTNGVSSGISARYRYR